MRKKWTAAVIVLVLLAIAGVAAGMRYFNRTYITVGEERYLLAQQELEITVETDEELEQIARMQELKLLDLKDSRLTTGQYDALRAALPQCRIIWKVPFQGEYLPADTGKIRVTRLTDEDMQMLAYFPELTEVDASECGDYECLEALAGLYPDLKVSYNVTVEGKRFPNTTTDMELEKPDVEEMVAYLRFLPQLQKVTLTALPEEPDALLELEQLYPEVTFCWQVQVCGITVDRFAQEIDLSGIRMGDTLELESKLKYMPNLEKVDMCDCGISNEEMEALNNRHEGILFVWKVWVGLREYRTDVNFFMPVKYHTKVTKDDIDNLRYLTQVEALDVGHMKIYSCEFIRYMPHLKYLILADTGIRDISPLEGLQELIYLELFVNSISDLSPLTSLTALEDLNLCYILGAPYDPVVQMPWLKRLWWTNERLTAEEQAYIRECLPDTEIDFDSLSSTGDGWRLGQNYFDMRDVFGMGYMTH